MTIDVAVFDENNVITAINVHSDNYELQSNEKLVTNTAFIGGDYYEGYFYPPKPFNSWQRDLFGNWVAPVQMPTNGIYYWNEEKQTWIQIEE